MAGNYVFSTVAGHIVGRRRAIGFLQDEKDPSAFDAKVKFDSLSPKKDRELRSRFDYWLSGAGPNDKWFHSWPNDHVVKECFCFRWDENKQHNRLYGFLYHPQPRTNARFELCVLIYHEAKNDESTDRNLLVNCMRLRADPLIRAAIGLRFPDEIAKGDKK